MGFDPLSMGATLASSAFDVWKMDQSQNAASNEAHEERQWAQDMRANAYQTTVKDLQKAGLNPMLAYSHGPTGMPSGAAAGAGAMPLDSLATTASKVEETQTNAAQRENIKADTKNKEATTANIAADTELKLRQAGLAGAHTAQSEQELNRIAADIDRIHVETDRMYDEMNKLKSETAKMDYYRQNIQPLEKRLTQLEVQHRELALPEARSNARYYSGPGGTYRPYLHDVGQAFGALSGAAGTAAALRFATRGINPNARGEGLRAPRQPPTFYRQ